MMHKLAVDSGLDVFSCMEVLDESSQKVMVCVFVSGEQLNIWGVSKDAVYSTSLTEDSIRTRSTALNLTSPEYLTIFRNALHKKAISVSKSESGLQINYKYSSDSEIKFDLKEIRLSPETCFVVLQAAGQKDARSQASSSPGKDPSSTPPSSHSTYVPPARSLRPAKKMKMNPNTSRINPGTRVVKAPKGVKFDDDD